MQLKVGDIVQYINDDTVNIPYLQKGDIGIIEKIEQLNTDVITAIIRWQNDKVKIEEYVYCIYYLKIIDILIKPDKKWYSTEGHKSIWDLAEEQYEQKHICNK